MDGTALLSDHVWDDSPACNEAVPNLWTVCGNYFVHASLFPCSDKLMTVPAKGSVEKSMAARGVNGDVSQLYRAHPDMGARDTVLYFVCSTKPAAPLFICFLIVSDVYLV
ncbi:hypothetical protein FAY30_22860 [Bacillus sp. S3]|uniref:hypothetical protein n=1 Tax=Bacillus sp. S3 TaxID=486398 RepID=UPI001188BA6A|nr:hypothetical protein [Bacillus sp. S3]QCJ44523.1 hypothetical protein FAY30_22860 [Bacillus sp. S3]